MAGLVPGTRPAIHALRSATPRHRSASGWAGRQSAPPWSRLVV